MLAAQSDTELADFFVHCTVRRTTCDNREYVIRFNHRSAHGDRITNREFIRDFHVRFQLRFGIAWEAKAPYHLRAMA